MRVPVQQVSLYIIFIQQGIFSLQIFASFLLSLSKNSLFTNGTILMEKFSLPIYDFPVSILRLPSREMFHFAKKVFLTL